MATAIGNLTIAGVEYVVVAKADYLRLVKGVPQDQIPPGSVDAETFARAVLGKSLRAAREAAGFTQAELADRMGKSQTLISQAESAALRVGERHAKAVLKACGLPMDWTAPKVRARKPSPKGKRGQLNAGAR